MSCPTCDHTMQFVCWHPRSWHCPRCGTMKQEGEEANKGRVDVPKLVATSGALCEAFRIMVVERYGEVDEAARFILDSVEECLGKNGTDAEFGGEEKTT